MVIGDQATQGHTATSLRGLVSPRSVRPILVGRERELDLLRAHLADAVAGRGGLVLIGGEAGIGKTALVDTLCHAAAALGGRVVVGHCYDRTETPPYGPWRECLAQFREAGAAANPQVTPPSLDSVPSQAVLFKLVRDTAVALAAERALVLVLEDLHWADPATLDLLRFVGRALANLPILVIATYRNDEVVRHHPLAVALPLLVREAGAERLWLRPFDLTDIETLVRARYDLPEAETGPLAAYVFGRTEGNALFATELLRTLEEERLLWNEGETWYVGTIALAPVPRLLTQVIDERLSRLGDEAAALLAVAAVIGHEVPLAAWQESTGADDVVLDALVDRAEAAHLVVSSSSDDTFRFTHALIREVLYEGVPAIRRRRLHRRVGNLLAALPGADPGAVAYHYQRAGDEQAAVWLVQAAERAEDAFARRTAAARYEAAADVLRAHHAEVEAHWVLLRAVLLRRYEDAEAASARATEILEAALAGRCPRLIAYARIVYGYTLASRGLFGAALRSTQAGLDALSSLSSDDASRDVREQPFAVYLDRGPLVVWLAFVGRLAEARADGERLLASTTFPATVEEGARQAPIWSALAYVYIMQGDLEGAWRTDAMARRVHDATHPRRLVIPPIRAAFVREVLACVADDPRARELIVAEGDPFTRRVKGAPPAEVRVSYAHYLRLPLLVIEGRWQEASELADRLSAGSAGYSVENPRRIALGLIARARGEVARAWQFVREAFPAGAATDPGEMHFSFALAMQRLAIELALDTEDRAAARDWLDAHLRWLAWSGATLGHAHARILEARYQRLVGDRAKAEIEADAGLAAASAPRQPLALLAAHRVLGEIRLEAGQVAQGSRHLSSALALADACRAPFERALTLLARAEVAARTGDGAGAGADLAAARTLLEALAAGPSLARADRLAAAIATPAPLPGGLSAREAEVLSLVAAGLTNAQIADHLFLSPRTVNGHLTTIYAKLGVGGRPAAIRFALDHHLA